MKDDVLYSIADYCPDIEELNIENCTGFTNTGVYYYYYNNTLYLLKNRYIELY